MLHFIIQVRSDERQPNAHIKLHLLGLAEQLPVLQILHFDKHQDDSPGKRLLQPDMQMSWHSLVFWHLVKSEEV